jgi:hypothetical protein
MSKYSLSLSERTLGSFDPVLIRPDFGLEHIEGVPKLGPSNSQGRIGSQTDRFRFRDSGFSRPSSETLGPAILAIESKYRGWQDLGTLHVQPIAVSLQQAVASNLVCTAISWAQQPPPDGCLSDSEWRK